MVSCFKPCLAEQAPEPGPLPPAVGVFKTPDPVAHDGLG